MGIEDWASPDADSAQGPFRRLLPPRRSPSVADDVARRTGDAAASSTETATTSIFVAFDELVVDRVDSPFFTGLAGRAIICIQLSDRWVPDLDPVAAGLSEPGPLLRFTAYLGGGYPLLRSVLTLATPPLKPIEFEMVLRLTDGDVQEFCVAMLETRKVELHISHTHDRRLLPIEFSAPGGDNVLSRTMDQLSIRPYPADDSAVVQAMEQLSADFPGITDGFTERDEVRLVRPQKTSSFATVERSFGA